jgi:predicted metalloprotease
MKWRRTSGGGGVDDLRGKSSGGGIPVGRIGGGLGGAGIAGIIIALLFTFLGGGSGFDPGSGLDQLNPTPAATGNDVAQGPDPDANLVAFVRFVVDDIQESWTVVFTNLGQEYQPTTLRLFTARISTGCGAASSATGPFYCPVDRFVYLDLGFFRELRDRFGAPGDFAQAYVIAHEYGHHVQNLLGILPEVNRRQQENPGEANELSVKLELQADCFAGVWAHSAYEQNELEEGDLEEGLTAASSVGDDRIQQAATGRIDPESFTHGTAEQRRNWFLTGFQEGDPAACNTFTASNL